jgi:F-type H+-transporting ATPase subunit delta
MKLSITKLAEKTAERLSRENTKELAQILYLELQRQKKLGLLPRLTTEIERKICENEGAQLTQITSARELSEQEKSKISLKLEKKTGGKVVIKNIIDPRVISGIKIEMDDEIIDLSTKGAISVLANKLAGV